MHITFDIQAVLGDSRDRGIGKYSWEFLEAISQSGMMEVSCIGDFRKECFLHSHNLDSVSREQFSGYQLPGSSTADAGKLHILQSDALRRFYSGLDTDIIHISSLYETLPQYLVWGPQLLNGDFSHLPNTLVSATFYDAIPLIYPDHYMPSRIVRKLNEAAGKVYSQLDLLFAISESARQDAIKFFHLSPEQVVNIGSAAGDFYHPLPKDDPLMIRMREKWNPDHKKMIFYTGFGDFRKNHAGLLKAFNALPADLQKQTILVFSAAFPTDSKEEFFSSCKNISSSQVIFTGWVTNEELRALYNLADLFVFPSLYEGFGLPVLEAMKCGTPVILSNTSSLPEVMDLPEAQFNPQNTAQITERIVQGLTDREYRDKLIRYGLERQKMFSWKRVAETAVTAWKNALNEKKKRICSKISFPVVPLKRSDSFEAMVKETAAALKLGTVSGYSFHFPEKREKLSLEICKRPGIVSLLCEPGHPAKEDIYTHHLLFTQKIIFVESEEIRQKLYEFLPNHANHQIRIMPRDPSRQHEEITKAVMEFSQANALLDPGNFTASHPDLKKDVDMSECLYDTLYYPVKRRLLVDITNFYKKNNRSGIQRVVRQITEHLLADHRDWEIVPFALTDNGYYPLKYQNECWVRCPHSLSVVKYDLLLMLDSSWDEILEFEALFNTVKRNAGTIFFMVYDLIPLLLGETCHPAMPFVFDRWFRLAVQYADELICISKAVADQCADYIKTHDLMCPEQVLYIDSFILGSDIPIAHDEAVMRENVRENFSKSSPLHFLTVGTIEARKNHAVILQVFSELWKNGYDFSWHIFGKHGWKTEKFDELLFRNHEEIGKHIFIYDNPSDAEIQYAYRHSDAFVFPSIGEGFGLPLVEASYFGLPLLCSDLPVFHEVCGENAYYLDISSILNVYQQIKDWIQGGDKHKTAKPIWPYTWKDSANDLLRSMTTRNSRYVIKKTGSTYMVLNDADYRNIAKEP